MNILITGGAGFVGSNLAIKLKRRNPQYNIVCMDNLKRRGSELNLPRLKKEKINFIHGDIRNKEDFDSLPKYDLMIECSAEPSVLAGINSSPKYLLNTNLNGTLNCLESIRKNSAKIIFLSTSRVYPIERINNSSFRETPSRFEIKECSPGISKEGVSEEFPLDGSRSLYGGTKLSSEIMIKEYSDSYNTDSIINRCGVITGPWQMGKVDQGVVVLWVARHFFGGNLSYIGYGGEGKQVRDFINVDDLFEIIDLQIKYFSKFKNQTFNIGGGKENSFSLQELTKICQGITGNKIEISKVSETRKSDLKYFVTDATKIRELSGWKPKKDLNQTIQEIYQWLKNNEKDLREILS